MYYKNNYKQTSFPLITTNSNHQYQINQQAVKFIKNIPQPIAVISVAGLYRTGKSYLLNRVLLNRSDGFNVGPTVNPCTKGLWIWGKPIIGRNKNNQLVNVLIIDSQGFGAVYQDANHDARIFALTLLLSSCFLYNSVGSIDQMALQNVSLVTNIAKSIRQKNKQNENQTENYLENFPQFYWILRDFSLQLITGEGKQLTAKQYLQKALQISSKDPHDDKSKIRKALTTYFPQRDCITLVRPLTNQQNLQELDRMEFQKLRPEFVQQIILMRKKILNSLKIKKFFGKAIDGEIFCQIIDKYVNIINNGAVPNIQNIWTYISKNQCQKAKHQAILYFEENINERIIDRMPLSPEQFQQTTIALKKSILTQFKKKIVNFDNNKQIKNELQSLMNKRIGQLKKQNEKESRKELERCVELEFEILERKIKSGDFKSIAEMHHQIEKYAKQFHKNTPIKGILGHSILNQFLIRKIFEGSENMMRARDAQINKLKNGTKDNQKKYENQIKQLKNQLNSLKNTSVIKINKLEAEKSQLISRQQNLRQAYSELKAEKDKLAQSIQNESKRQKNLSNKAYQQIKSKISVYENQAQAYQRKIFLLNSECEKKQALLNQKIEYQEKIIDELKRKEQKSYEELKNMKETFNKQIKQANSRTDTTNKTNQKKMVDLYDKISEYENQINRLSQQLLIQKQQNEKSYSENSMKFEELNKTINKINTENRQKQMFYRNKLAQKLNDDSRFNDKINFLEDNLKQKEETIKNLRLQINKGKAILNQKHQLYENEIQELKKKYQEQITKNQSIFKLLQNKQSQKIQIMAEIKNQYINEIQKNEQEKKTLKNQLNLLNKKKNEIQSNLNNQIDELRKQWNTLSERYESVQEAKNKLFEQNKQNENQKMKYVKLAQRNGTIIKSLEKQIQVLKQQVIEQTREIQRKNQEALSQLKKFYESEKEKLENIIFEYQQKYKDLQTKKSLEQSHLHQNANQIYTDQILELRQEAGKEKQKLIQQIDKYKYLCAQLQEAKNEVQSNYQKDKQLFQIKLRFVQSQKQQAKADLTDAMKKFEIAVEQMNRSKSSNENLEDITKSLQKKNFYQIESVKESYEKRIVEIQQKNNKLVSELRNMKQIYNDLKNEKESKNQRQKIQKIHLNQLSHLTHLQNSSEQYEKQIFEYQERLLRQKQQHSKRVIELQKKIKESQMKSNNITYGFEKEYVKWNIDRKCLEDKIEDLLQANQKIYRELERFKNKEKNNEKDKERDKHSTRRLFRLE